MGEAKRKKVQQQQLIRTTLKDMLAMPLNSFFVTDRFMITRVPGGWLYSRNWDGGVGAHSTFVAAPELRTETKNET